MGLRGTPLANATDWSTGARDPIQIARMWPSTDPAQRQGIPSDGVGSEGPLPRQTR